MTFPTEEPQIDFRSLLPFPKELDGTVHLGNEQLITCYRVLLSLHQFLSDALALPIPDVNRVLCGIMRNDLERALLGIRTMHEMQTPDSAVGET